MGKENLTISEETCFNLQKVIITQIVISVTEPCLPLVSVYTLMEHIFSFWLKCILDFLAMYTINILKSSGYFNLKLWPVKEVAKFFHVYFLKTKSFHFSLILL